MKSFYMHSTNGYIQFRNHMNVLKLFMGTNDLISTFNALIVISVST